MPIKFMNVPWHITSSQLRKYILKNFGARTKFCKVLYDQKTGLSRGVALTDLDNPKLSAELKRKATIEMGGRSVFVLQLKDKAGLSSGPNERNH